MAFTGKATYSAGATLPETLEDVSDLVALNSPHDTPLLDALGDAAHPARSTVHEWLEDALLPDSGAIDDDDIVDPLADAILNVADATRFRVGDQLQPAGSAEILLVTAVSADAITVTRGYGGTTPESVVDGQVLRIVGNAALEGADASSARFTTRSRAVNYTQIFASTVEVSGSQLAVRQIGVRDELDWQKTQRLRELVRDLENSVLNGVAPTGAPEGSATVRRTMRGVVASIATHRFAPGAGGFPSGTTLSETQLNQALRSIWQISSGRVDLLVAGGAVKRAINQFVASTRRFGAQAEAFHDGVSVYESDFGVCRVILSRHVPAGMLLLLDSSRIEVKPLAGRHFHYKPLASDGDHERGQVIGEYTLEFRNESAHGLISGLA